MVNTPRFIDYIGIITTKTTPEEKEQCQQLLEKFRGVVGKRKVKTQHRGKAI